MMGMLVKEWVVTGHGGGSAHLISKWGKTAHTSDFNCESPVYAHISLENCIGSCL